MNNHFWKSKKVLLTGHTGFKGSWLSLWLQSMGADLIGYSLRPPTNPNLYDIANVGLEMQSVIGDIRDFDLLKSVVDEYSPEIVIHMAAQPLVRYSYRNPVETYSTNVMGTVNLLEAVRLSDKVRVVINVTSDKCYENREWLWGYREDDAVGGFDPYSNSKGCSELVTASYRNSFFPPNNFSSHGLSLASARAGNVIGGGDWADDRLIPDLIRAIDQDKPIRIRNPNSIRPWQHVLEPLSGYLLLAERMYKDGASFSESWNFGPDDSDAKPVKWILNQIINSWGIEKTWMTVEGDQLHEAQYLRLDCSKSKARLNWAPRWAIDRSIDNIVQWHKSYSSNENMRELTIKQIDDYCASYG
jgi:CDP-glucose 4,6-dehydratase